MGAILVVDISRNKDFVNRVVALEQAVIGLKTPQPSGTSNTRAYEIVTNKVWDADFIAEPMFDGATNAFFRIVVIFKADSQAAPFASLAAIMEFDGIPYDFKNNDSIRVGSNIFGILTGANQAGVESWTVEGQVPLNTNVKLKFRVWATDKGRIVYGTGYEALLD